MEKKLIPVPVPVPVKKNCGSGSGSGSGVKVTGTSGYGRYISFSTRRPFLRTSLKSPLEAMGTHYTIIITINQTTVKFYT